MTDHVESAGVEEQEAKPKKAKKEKPPKEKKPQFRFGIGEWYGKSFEALSGDERRNYATIQGMEKKDRPAQPCPFKKDTNCSKDGGICSLRSYEKNPTTGEVKPSSKNDNLRTTCPSRFEEGAVIYEWVGEVILEKPDAIPTGETPFLQPVPLMGPTDTPRTREVGRIDNVLVVKDSKPLEWAPVEKQAVYFSGKKMSLDFENIKDTPGDDIPFPLLSRRPDYRSSGPKRLLPQLETKVPTLRTWGKKMAVVVDEDFFNQLGQMKEANDISNAEVIWFVVRYAKQADGQFKLTKGREPFITTLKDAVDGLVAAVPVARTKFEGTIVAKMNKITGASTS